MTQLVKTYDPSQVQVLIGGVPATGIGPDTFVKVTQDDVAYNKNVGADGEVSRSRSSNRMGMLELTLKQTSDTNDELSAFALADQAENAGIFPVMIKEGGSGRSLMMCASAWVEKWPDVEYAREEGVRTWMIALGSVNWYVGGNAAAPAGA